MLLLLQFFRNSKVALWVVSTRRESDESLMQLLVQEKRKFFILNKELENENKLVSRIVQNGLVVCKNEIS